MVDRAYSVTEMISAINENRVPLTDISVNIHSFAMITASLESIEKRTEIQLKKN
ncbi:hypothetical protein [Gracilibacillus oryzae]|uniref:hypothetical protein n=1 Tax=Gracilibacillus oryzae TaxID=1672701 RepID=UPI0012980EED|nr:hypothetical protein [Gracilibacillus oryzae]